jgi:hypothetical protein
MNVADKKYIGNINHTSDLDETSSDCSPHLPRYRDNDTAIASKPTSRSTPQPIATPSTSKRARRVWAGTVFRNDQ